MGGAALIVASGVKNIVAKTTLTLTKEVAAGGIGGLGSYVTASKLDGEKVTARMVYWGIKDSLNGKVRQSKEPSIGAVMSETLHKVASGAMYKVKGPQGVLYLNITQDQKIREEILTDFMMEQGFTKKDT